MKTLGILLACHHYPDVRPGIRHVDGQLRRWLSAAGHTIDDTRIYQCHEGNFPSSATDGDIWLVSGTFLIACPLGRDLDGRMHQFLRAAAAVGHPVFGIHHGEHLVHTALAAIGTPRPGTAPTPRSIRNPFASFHSRDRLFRFDPQTRLVNELARPETITLPSMFASDVRAA